ncbi:GGDEF domain-containing protein [Clostridium sp. AWRP]|uniref:GGDEF domain-containing protein n=1 Tax=Clostridium sp. AWRP TaxID=2212991 RepID=UPI000FD6F084|nr:GGDEF domain-containing protein [Clostridium sp. AWRP]AZV57641.2 diguanylate cyclase [Clostridium sp. AWRP]
MLYGITAGALGGFLIPFIMEGKDYIPVDFQNFAILISAINGGFLASFITGLVISFFSIVFVGISYQTILTSITILSISVGCGLISKCNVQKAEKWIYMISSSLILHFLFMNIVLSTAKINNTIYKKFIIYSILTIIFGFIIYYICKYINQSSLLFMHFKEDSYKDFLTGLNNVRNFNNLFNDLSKKAAERKERLSLIMIDIDWFKKINDTYGHPSGDEVLKQIALILKRTCRSFDIISRNGGEEFSILLINCSNTQAIEIGEQIRKAIENHEFILSTGEKINVSVSIGVTTYPDIVNSIEEIIESADIALYEAKHTGRNKVIPYY